MIAYKKIVLFSYILFNFLYTSIVSEQQTKILSQDGHLILYAAENKNISLQTKGGGIHVNGIDVAKAAKISNSAMKAMIKYKTNFESSFEKISKLEQLLDDKFIEKVEIMNSELTNTSTSDINSQLVEQNIQGLNRKINALQRTLSALILLNENECESDPCKNGGICQDIFNGFICSCPPEWEGSLCEKDVNECTRFTGTDLGCQNGATCVNRQGSYECLCSHGWAGLHCTRRTKDCNFGSDSELCGHGTCVIQYDNIGYKCICDQGWTTDDKNLACTIDVDECSMNKPPCSNNPLVQCINLPGSFRCGNCPPGYSGNGFYCLDIDECIVNNGGCSTNPMVKCINTIGSRICGNCPAGYSGNGIICSYQNICSINNGGCSPLATCKSDSRIDSTFVECICFSGYTGNGIGPNGCVQQFNENLCTPNPCKHGSCKRSGSNNYTCDCHSEIYTGRHCESYRDLCQSNPCLNGGVCTSILGVTFTCNCSDSYTGFRCNLEKQECGSRFQAQTGTLTYPSRYSFKNYISNISCTWTIETSVNQVLNITFKHFNLKFSDDCQNEWLQINDGQNAQTPSIGKFCDSKLPKNGVIISTHNNVYLWFKSDNATVNRGFELSWTSIDPVCGNTLTEVTSHGTLHSPGSPGNYPNNRDCYWPLKTPLGKRLLFHFFTLMIGDNSHCEKDYLEFISGTLSTDKVFAKFCNTSHPSPLFSPGPEVLVHFHSDSDKNYPGFQITYSVVEGIPGCGGVYTNQQGEIRSPSFNGRYPNDVLCEYKIQVPLHSRIKLTFASFALEGSQQCELDYVAIHAGSTSDDPLISRYCGSNLPSPYVTESNTVLIVFKTDSSLRDDGFVLIYETVCTKRFKEPSGIVKSYPRSIECIYEIIQPLRKNIELNIFNIDFKQNSSIECISNFLEIRDGPDENSLLIGRYCKKQSPLLIVSTYNYLWIKFRGNGEFWANYTTTNLECGGVLKDKTDTISTPNYPNLYTPRTVCKWIILAPPSNVIQLAWTNFQLEENYKCTFHYVKIFENNTKTGNGSLMGQYCGKKIPPLMLASSNMITIDFFSDNLYNKGTFQATYTFLKESNVCGGNYFSNFGTIKSPGYPNDYDFNLNCIWIIHVKPGHQILLNVTDFALEEDCRADWLEIRNGRTASSPLLGKYCGTTIPNLIHSHTNQLYIRFKSDSYISWKGFKIIWEATATGCGGTLNGLKGILTSPNYPEPYDDNIECIWKISGNTGSVIRVTFSDLNTQDQVGCSSDYVEVFDGPTLNSKFLGSFCSIIPLPIQSTSSNVIVKFRTDDSQNARGFQLEYETICNYKVRGFRGAIESPNFPGVYPENINCTWEIEVPLKNKINITFSHFDLNPNDDECTYSFLEILYQRHKIGYEKYGKYCGNDIPTLITLNSDHAKIHFVSLKESFSSGFRLEWQNEGCGGILTSPTDTITSPHYPEMYIEWIECDWKIQADYGKNIEITIYKLEMEENYSCDEDYIQIFNGEDETYPEITKMCRQYQPTTLRSTGNFMFLKYKMTGIFYERFYANYTFKTTKCGGKYIADKGNIMSPNYPKNYNPNDTCGYLIQVTEGYKVELTFDDVDLFPTVINCKDEIKSFMKVYDGPSIDYPLIVKVCNRNIPNETFTSYTNIMYVEMVTYQQVSKGFFAKFQKSCGIRIDAEGNGLLKINKNDFTHENGTCSWSIISKDLTKHISLMITRLDIECPSEGNIKPLQIFNGETSDAPLLGQYCGKKNPPTLISDGPGLHIILNKPSVLFAAYTVFDSICGGELTGQDGFFSSPGYPKTYPMETECEWTLEVAKGNHVSLYFSYFELLASDHCNNDYLEIRRHDDNGTLLGVFCSSQLPTNITNVGSLRIILKTSRFEDGSIITAKGFMVEYSLNRENELFGTSGTIMSPLYHQEQSPVGYFSWKITAKGWKGLLLEIKNMNSYKIPNNLCTSQMKIYDGPNEKAPHFGEYCGTITSHTLRTRSNVVFIKVFNSENLTFPNKFIIEWQAADTKDRSIRYNSTSCGTQNIINLNDLQKSINLHSPGYPSAYDEDLYCEWIYTTIQMNSIKLYFTDMDLNNKHTEYYLEDYIEIYEKKINSDWKLINKIYKIDIRNKTSFYAANLMKIVFTTDSWNSAPGFSAYVGEACGGYLTDPSGFIIYDNVTRQKYENTTDKTMCQWNITVGAVRTIKIEILKLHIDENENKSCENYLMIRNGKFPNSPILGTGKYCNSKEAFSLTTTGNNAYIKYSGFAEAADIKIRYSEISYSCGDEISLSHSINVVEINSPNYPNASPAFTECMWRIIAPPGEILRIDFIENFYLLPSAGCTKEYVEVRDGGTVHSKLIGKFCSSPSSSFTTDNMIFIKYYTESHDPGNGFKARISLANCGGTIRGKFGQIQSPFFDRPERYPISINCTWRFIAPTNHNMKIKFNKLDLEEHHNCTKVDHVTIYEENGPDNEVNIFGHYCGKTIPPIIKTSENKAVIHFVTNKENNKHLRGFSMEFVASFEACGGDIEASEGTITLPGYPSPHRTVRLCSWLIKVPYGRRVTFTIEDIDLDPRFGTAYMYGLTFYQYKYYKGYIKNIKTMGADKTVQSSENTLYILYFAPGHYGRGFKAKFSSNEPSVCEGDFNQGSGILTQPKELMSSYICTYIRDKLFSTNTTLAMTITIITNSTRNSNTDCFVEIMTGDEEINLGRFSALIKTNDVIRSPFPSNKIVAVQGNQKCQLNYTVSYKTYSCGGIINGEIGTIESPGYPNKYFQTIECSWLIQLPEGQTIQLTFNSMDLGDNCSKSYIDIYNGNSPSSPKIERYCQNHKPDFILSQTNNLWIDYKHDQDSNGTGFSVKYEPMIRGCGGIFHDHTRIIQTPSYPKQYPNNAECLWELRTDEGYNVDLTFNNRFQIEQSNDCQNDFVEIFDWKNGEWISLGKKCGREVPKSVSSTSNRMKILFRSNDQTSGQGFRVQWKWNCGGTFFADKIERFIETPRYPPRGELVCHYIIKVNDYKHINIRLYDINLKKEGSSCRHNNVTVGREPNDQNIFCGTKNLVEIRIFQTIHIIFKRDNYFEGAGFKFSYYLDKCGGNITSARIISSPALNITATDVYMGDIFCKWIITAPPKKIIVIRFQKFSFIYLRDCLYNHVEIYEGSKLNMNKRIANLCGNLNNELPIIKTKNNSAIITMRADKTKNQAGFKAEIYFTDGPEAGCGGRIDLNNSTILTAPNLDDVDCFWDIYAPTGSTIQIQFSELSLPVSCGPENHSLLNCRCALLEIKDGNGLLSETIEKFCGITSSSIERQLTTSTNIASIRFYGREHFDKAFKIIFTPIPSLCGPVELQVSHNVQILTSPGYPNSYPDNLKCAWILRAPSQFVIRFIDLDLNEDNDGHITNACNGDKFQIIDTSYSPISNGLGPKTIIFKNSKSANVFSDDPFFGTYQFCGKPDIHFDYYSQSKELTLTFSSGNINKNRGRGFKIQYGPENCNRNYTSLQGRMFYGVRYSCIHIITVPNNYTISLYFQQFKVRRPHQDCHDVGIEIRDGSDRSAPLIQKYCGYALPNPIFSTKNNLWIYSWNKLIWTRKDWSKLAWNRSPFTFDLVYTSSDQGRGCGGVLYNYKGRFSSPLFPSAYRNNVQCIWDVRVPIGMRVALTFSTFDIQGNCGDNYVKVTIYDKEVLSNHTFCKNDNPATLYSNSHLLVTYQSSNNNGGTGWYAQFEATD